MKKNNIYYVIAMFLPIIVWVGTSNVNSYTLYNEANIKTLFATLVYLLAWVIVLRIGIKFKSRSLMVYGLIIWLLTCFAAAFALYVSISEVANLTEATTAWALLLYILFLLPLAGIAFISSDLIVFMTIIGAITLVIAIVAIRVLRVTKRIRKEDTEAI